MGSITLLDRYKGAMVGTLAGDAAGAPYENQKSAYIAEDLNRRRGLVPFDYIDPWQKTRQMKAGNPTDDAELSACLGLSLVKYPNFNHSDVYDRLRSFIHGRKSVLTNGEAYGSGGTLRDALKYPTYKESVAAFAKNEIRLVPSNGSLMRSASVALCFHGDVDLIIGVAWRQSSITHMHPVAQATCVAYSVLMEYLLYGYDPRSAWRKTEELVGAHEYCKVNESMLSVLNMRIDCPLESEIWPRTGGAMISLRIAVWALLSAANFREGLTRVIRLGGDVDTYGAIVGGLLGATYGTEGVPTEWREVLIGREIMESIADRLHLIYKLRWP